MKLFGARGKRRSLGLSIVDNGLIIRGEIDTDGTIRVDGRVEGRAHRAGTLVVGARGELVGDVEAGDVIVAGTIHGNVNVTGRIEIEPGAAVHGEIRASQMLLHEGAALYGQVSVGTTPVSAAPPAASRRLELAQTPAQSARAHV